MPMKAFLIYSHSSGHKRTNKDIAHIKKELSGVFETLDFFCSFSKEEAYREIQSAAIRYDALLIYGGDGTFNNVLNAIMPLTKKPILGFINGGTMGDIGRNFGIKRSLSSAIKAIKAGKIAPFDVGEMQTASGRKVYFGYMAAIGAYSDVAYSVERKRKRAFGHFAYYHKALSEAFRRTRVSFDIAFDSERLAGETPFIMILNGRYVGGFKVNGRASLSDGKAELFITRKGMFNGLMHYLPLRKKETISFSEIDVSMPMSGPWCLDGEELREGIKAIGIRQAAVRVYANSPV